MNLRTSAIITSAVECCGQKRRRAQGIARKKQAGVTRM